MSAVTVEVLTREEAERLTEGIRTALDRTARGMADLGARVAAAYQRRADLALGYESWSDYAKGEFGEQTQHLAAPIRRELVGYLSAEGLSTRAIAPAVSKTHMTVARDIEQVSQDVTPAEPAAESEPEPEPAPASPVERTSPEPAPEPEPEPAPVVEPKPEPRKVTGLDGKQYSPPKPRPKTAPVEKTPEHIANDKARENARIERQNAEQEVMGLGRAFATLTFLDTKEARTRMLQRWKEHGHVVNGLAAPLMNAAHMRKLAAQLVDFADQWEQENE